MRVANKTRWDSKPLRKLIARIAEDECESDKRKRLRVHVVPARQQYGCSGLASLGGSWSTIRLPTKVVWTEHLQIDLCTVIAHELAHNHGHRGERWMRRSVRYGRPRGEAEREQRRALYAWALAPEYMMRLREPKPMSTPGDDAKLAKAQARLIDWQRRAKRAANKIRKYTRTVKYYERKLAAMPTAGTHWLHDARIA